MKLIGIRDMETPFDGQYLYHYDPDKPMEVNGVPMVCTVLTTPYPEQAKKFENVGDLHAEWTRVCEKEPVRPDGKPNRPLTAFTIESLSLDEAMKG